MQKLILPNDVLLPEVERMLSDGKTVTLRVKGNSMLPFITGDRDSVVLQKTPQLRKGDIVLAKHRGRYVLHRIIRIDGDRLVLMGDGNIRGVEQCNLADVAGRAVRILRKGYEIECDSTSHRFKAAVWRSLKPLRRYILAVYRRI